MKLETEQNGLKVTLDVPEPVEQDGVWYEPVEYRKSLGEEYTLDERDGRIWFFAINNSTRLWWIMRPIPRGTPEQLTAFGMRERDTQPKCCNQFDKIWDGETCRLAHFGTETGKHRWILVPDVKPEPKPHYSCEGCVDEARQNPRCVDHCKAVWNDQYQEYERSDWTLAPPPEPTFTVQDVCWIVMQVPHTHITLRWLALKEGH